MTTASNKHYPNFANEDMPRQNKLQPQTANYTNLYDTTRHNLMEHPQQHEAHAPEHIVQFYETEGFLLYSLANFISVGLEADETCIVIATKAHYEQVEKQLLASRVNLTSARMRGAYVTLSARATLSKLMVDGLPAPERFTEVVGNVTALAAKRQRPVRVFGEMVALLWLQGNQAAAIRLETLWNELLKGPHPFSLVCAYAMSGFAGTDRGAAFAEVCQRHSSVIPGESYTTLTSPEERLRTISLLQQKAYSLENQLTESKATQDRLRMLAAIVESSDDAILSKDLEGIITSWNSSAEHMFGYTAAEIIGQPVTHIYPTSQYNEFHQIMERIRRGERIDHYRTRRMCKDGTMLTVSVTVSPVKDASGAIIGASDIIRDLTEQQRLEAKSQQLFASNLVGIFVADGEGTTLEANQAFLDLLGYTREEWQAGALQQNISATSVAALLRPLILTALQETSDSEPKELVLQRKSGKDLPVLVAVACLEDRETCIGFVLDISERKALEQRKDEFISMASHELKTPVTSLKSFTQVLKRRLQLEQDADPQTFLFLDRMDVQLQKLANLISDLLDISKMQTGTLAFRETRFDFDELVRETVENVQAASPTHHLYVQGETDSEIDGDRDRLGQVLTNLLTNAIKYSPEADSVIVHLNSADEQVEVAVQDFGIGIAHEHYEHIFERFYQVTDQTNTYPGLGIGLYIARAFVERHGGRLWLESRKGAGSTFHFTLPDSQQGASYPSLSYAGEEEE